MSVNKTTLILLSTIFLISDIMTASMNFILFMSTHLLQQLLYNSQLDISQIVRRSYRNQNAFPKMVQHVIPARIIT